jgi:hypothetical protein
MNLLRGQAGKRDTVKTERKLNIYIIISIFAAFYIERGMYLKV